MLQENLFKALMRLYYVYLLAIGVTLFAPHESAFGQEQCDQLKIQLFSHLGAHHVAPLSGQNLELFWYDETTGFGLRKTVQADSEGLTNLSKSALISELESKGGRFPGTHLLITLPSPFKESAYFKPYLKKQGDGSLPYTDISPIQVKIQGASVGELLSSRNCDTFKPTFRNHLMTDDEVRGIRSKFTAVWAINAAQDYLMTTLPPRQGNTPLKTEINFAAEGKYNSFARQSYPGKRDHFVQLDLLNESRTAFMTVHEIGHVLMFDFLNINSDAGPHLGHQCYTTELALSEGFATFFAYATLQSHGAKVLLNNTAWTDDNIFTKLEKNFTDQMSRIISPSFAPANCYSYENETLVAHTMSKLLFENISPFDQIWSALQINPENGVSSFEEVLSHLFHNQAGSSKAAFENFLEENHLYFGPDSPQRMLSAKQYQRGYSMFIGQFFSASRLCFQTSLDSSYFGKLGHGDNLAMELTGKPLAAQSYFKGLFQREYDPLIGFDSIPATKTFYMNHFIELLNSIPAATNKDYLCVRFEQIYEGLNNWRRQFCKSSDNERFTRPLFATEGFDKKFVELIEDQPQLLQRLRELQAEDVNGLLAESSGYLSSHFDSTPHICRH